MGLKENIDFCLENELDMYNPQNEMYKIAKRNVHKFQGVKI